MSNAASSLQSIRSDLVPVFINDDLVMLDRATLNALKAMAYDQGCSVEKIMSDAIAETLADPVRLARVTELAKVSGAASAH